MIPVLSIKPSLQKTFGAFFSTEEHPEAEILRYINEGVRILCKKYPWYFLEKESVIAVNDTNATYAIQETIDTLLVEIGSGDEITNIATKMSDYKRMTRELSPVVGIWDTTFKASLEGTYTIIHTVYPNRVTSVDDSIAIPDNMLNILIEYTLAFGYMTINDYSNSLSHSNNAAAMLPSEMSRKYIRNSYNRTRVSSKDF